MMESARLFVGLELGAEARAALSAYRRALAAAVEGNLPDPSLYHLTLNFLGQVPRERIPALCALLDATRVPPLALSLGALGTFKGGSILWIGLEQPPRELFALQGALASALNAAGFPAESGAYSPHITLGRRVRLTGELPAPPRTAFTAEHVTLFESARVDGRLRYTPLHRSST